MENLESIDLVYNNTFKNKCYESINNIMIKYTKEVNRGKFNFAHIPLIKLIAQVYLIVFQSKDNTCINEGNSYFCSVTLEWNYKLISLAFNHMFF